MIDDKNQSFQCIASKYQSYLEDFEIPITQGVMGRAVLNKKCLTLREETERPITVLKGTNKVIGVNKNILNEINEALNTKLASHEEIELWDGNTSERIFEDFIGK